MTAPLFPIPEWVDAGITHQQPSYWAASAEQPIAIFPMKHLTLACLLILTYAGHPPVVLAQTDLAVELDRLENYLGRRDASAPEVSVADVAWHLDHALKVVLKIYEALEMSDAGAYSYSINPVRAMVFATGRFPRGVAKAPKEVTPPDDIFTEDVLAQLAEARALLPMFSELDRRKFYDHFMFGKLNRRRAMKFLVIHTRHHLRIVEDIVNAAEAQGSSRVAATTRR